MLSIFISCKEVKQKQEHKTTDKAAYIEIIRDDYELFKPTMDVKAVLILFGGFMQDAKGIKKAFGILNFAKQNNIAVIYSNVNQKLWLEEDEKHQLAKNLQGILEEHQLPSDNLYIGGFSSGGVISLLISDYITGTKSFYMDPKGVFIIDAPIDLAALYVASKKHIERNVSELSIAEATFLTKILERNLGTPDQHMEHFEDKSVFTYSTDHTSNLEKLKWTKIRLYTEPDPVWWKTNRMADFDQTNAFYIQKLAERLQVKGFENVEYIPTSQKGYRANGERHPHSWSIVDKQDLVDWMLNTP